MRRRAASRRRATHPSPDSSPRDWRPGTAARQIVESMTSPLRVLLFFPPANEVKDQVLGYFRALDAAAENITIDLPPFSASVPSTTVPPSTHSAWRIPLLKRQRPLTR